ncbi:filamentous hemagglutinin [Pseudomonas brassicacearum]|uniref:Filamentous hemagglutinin n=1 Tax=Pseudomonas brassicacearum TaxID=930166 RepID=A0AAW8M390_9PSED|nr:DUF637 domain-containing protein [Pseudomonas brassicacearum]MDR6956180.1 filamentous hemagglutinin [Pseudomonas brassicacearum]
MDDRQHAFLARQPSAALKNRERFLGMPKRGLAFLLANVMFWQPMWAQADGIVVSAPGTGLDQAGNGVPIVNIARPNGSGLSHNQFTDYNVGSNGVILNNATNRTQATQLGGIILGNPNLNGTAATTILNEVNGGNPSQLRGYTEVAGQSAHVIVANPYGITCNGCGFINSPKVTLSTGKAVIENGQLNRYQVDQGSVAIEGAGLNANNVDHFEIITRSAKINAEIQAKNLTIVAGRNDVNADTLNATARADDGSAKPQLAIDSSALGGMYAGAIKLVGTEAGVGVKLDGKLIASGGDIQLDANGHLSMVDASASGAVNVKAASLDAKGPVYAGTTLNAQTQGNLTNQQTLAARDGIVLSAGGQLSNNGIIEAGVNADNTRNATGDVSVTAQSLNNNGKSVIASRNVTANVAQTLSNQGGTLSAGQSTTVKAGTLDNQNKGRVLSSGTLSVTADKLLNSQGTVSSNGHLTANVGQLINNAGELSSLGNITLRVASLDNVAGLVAAGQSLDITASGQINNQNGRLTANKSAQLTAASLNNVRGVISAVSVASRSNSLDNSDGLISSRDRLDLNVDTLLDNQRGSIIADGALLLTADRMDNRQGTLISTDALGLRAISLDNRQAGLIGATKALDLNVDELDNRGGELTGDAGVTLVSQRLDNSDGGQVFAGQALNLTVDNLFNRTKGLLSAKGQLSVKGGSLDNTGGYLISQQDQRINLSRDLLNTQGQLSSEGKLEVLAANVTNTGGSFSSAADLNVQSLGRLDNQDGELVTDGALLLTSAALDNRQGHISGKGAVGITTGAFDNSQGGRLNSGSTLSLVAAQVTNQNGASIGSQGALTASVTGLDQQGGKLFSNATLSLDMNNGQLNNQGGLINAPGTLLLKNLNGVNNQGGEISSAEAFTLAAQNLTNDNGKLLSSQSLTLRIAQALNNVKGLIGAATVDTQAQSLNNNGGTLTSRGNLVLTIDQQLDNQAQGLISAAQLLTLNSGNLNNQGGSVLASGALTLNAMALNNSANGLINAQGDLILGADSLDSSDDGEVSAKGDMNLSLASLTQNGGRLLGEKAVTLNLGNGDLDNRNGLITAKSQLTFNGLRDLTNQGGEISSSQSFQVNGRTLDNSGGKLISGQNLSLDGQALINQNGLISGWQGLMVKGTSLDNRNNGTLSSRNGDVGVTLSGALLNDNAGALVSQKKLTVSAASLDNRGGILSSGGDQTLTVTGGLLNNAQNGLIDSGAVLVMNAMTLGNAGGTVNAQKALSFTGSALDNSGGNLIGNAAVSLDLLGALTNTNGKIASVGPLRVERATQINNQGGQIASQGLLTLLTGGLDNRNRGTVAANDQLILNTAGAVQNDADGLIYSQNGGVQIDAATLTNGKGTVQSQGAMTLTVATDVDNQSGRLQANAGDLLVVARHLDNRGGVLASLQGLFTTQLTGVLKNGYDLNNNRQGGITQAQRLSLTALGGIDNYGGRISAQTGDATVITGNFDNRNGGLYAKGKVSVTANDFDNSGDNDGQIAGSQIDLDLTGALNNRLGIIESDSTLAIKAASLDNQTGQLRALGTGGKTQFQIGNLFDNSRGRLEVASNDLILNAASFQNANGSLLHAGSGSFDISTENLTRAGGTVVTRGGLTLTADSWTNSSVIQAGRLTVNVGTLNQTAGGQLLASTAFVGTGGNWVNDGVIGSDGSLSLTLGGAYSGNGRLTSLGTLGLSANQVNSNEQAVIAGGARTDINVAGALTNAGRITSNSDLALTANTLQNNGTLGANQSLALKGRSLTNTGLLFSGMQTNLGVDSFANNGGAVYSLGDMDISGYATGSRTDLLDNFKGTIESAGTMTINASSLKNRGDAFTSERHLVSGFIAFACYDCQGSTYDILYGVREIYKASVDPSSGSGTLSAGKNFIFTGGDFLNSRSQVIASGDITINANNFTNEGAASGAVERTRTYRTGGISSSTHLNFLNGDLYNYNAHNDDGPQVFHYMNSETAFEVADQYGAGGDAVLVDKVTGKHLKYYSGFNRELGASQYDPDNLVQMPTYLSQFQQVGDIEISTDDGQVQSAVVQAGGKVNITATQNLTNSVIHEDYTAAASTSKVQDTRASGSGTTLVRINAQLPPDRAQQQVNPLSLPGFSLPTGQNGLFRLSGQAGNAVPVAQAAGNVQTWTMGSAAVSQAQRTQSVTDTQPSAIQLSQSAQQNAGVSTDPTTFPAGTPAASQTVAKVQGLPSSRFVSKPQKYLIETNPVLTDLKQFMSSDYLLSGLGYDPDVSAKRLGDGFYEQRLVQQAITARTGQAFIDGQTSNEAQFKYLMNNAIASKDALNLSVGVSLTSQQVAALTHDIVWLEEHEVNGEKVLVPVLYLAQANNRLGPTGALIAGNDVTLIAGQNLDNVGTLRASTNLSAAAGNNLVNTGLVQAGNRLDLLASNDLANKGGGIIGGRDVSMTTLKGDVINERSITTMDNDLKGRRHSEFADSAARVEAANDLSITASRDFISRGSVLDSGRDVSIVAGRDLTVGPTQVSNSLFQSSKHNSSDITQLSSTVTAGRDIRMQAGRDASIIASEVDAKRDIAIAATENVTVGSAADEQHSFRKSKKVTTQEDHVQQIGSTINAGRDVTLGAGKDMAIISSSISAGEEAYLVAGENLDVLAAQDSDYSLYDKKKKGSWGKKQTQRDEVTKITHVSSQITTGGNLTLVSGDDQHYQAAKLNSGDDLTLQSGGSITFEGVKDLHQESHEKTNNSAFWVSSKGKGNTDETLRQTQMVAAGNIMIKAVDGLKIDVKQVNQETVSQSIDAMVKADPKMAWLKEAEARGDVDWRQVKEIHESFKYNNSGLGPASQLIIAILMSFVMGPAGLGIVGAGAGGAVATSLATTAVTSTINNKGNLGAALKETFSADSLKGAAIAGVTAGVLNYADANWFSAASQGPKAANLLTSTNFTDVAIRTGGRAVLSSGISTAIGGGSFGDNLGAALMGEAGNVAMATGFNWVGDTVKFPEGSFQKVLAHALMGGLLAKAMGSDFKTGAVAAGANEALSNVLVGALNKNKESEMLISQLTGILAAAAMGGDIQVGADIAKNATVYNRQGHRDEEVAKEEEIKKGDFTKGNLDKATCYVIKCWAQYDRASAEYRENYLTETDMVGLSNELEWADAQREKGLFNYTYFDSVADFTTRDVIPIGADAVQATLGGAGMISGGTLCSTAIGCVFGGPMAVFGAGNAYEGGSGLYNHIRYGEKGDSNPVRDVFSLLPGGYGPLVYSGADLVFSAGAGFVKVPLKIGAADGLNASSLFGVTVRQMDNNYFVPLAGIKTPYGTALGVYFYGVGGKAADVYKEVGGEK